MNDHDVTNEVRLRRGLSPLPNPYFIAGFEDGIPAPRLQNEPGSREDAILEAAERPLQFEPIQAPQSPLEALGADPEPEYTARAMEHKTATFVAPSPTNQFVQAMVQEKAPAEVPVVFGAKASFDGHQVELNQSEQAAISGIILKAVQARTVAKLKSLGAAIPRRRRSTPAVIASDPAPPVVKRRPGRPKKVNV